GDQRDRYGAGAVAVELGAAWRDAGAAAEAHGDERVVDEDRQPARAGLALDPTERLVDRRRAVGRRRAGDGGLVQVAQPEELIERPRDDQRPRAPKGTHP